MLGLSTGLSGIQASQTALDIVAQNIANANTPGYHRQSARFGTRTPTERDNLLIGTGVTILNINRARDLILEEALTANLSDQSETSTRVRVARQIESMLLPGPGSLSEFTERFFNQLELLSQTPNDKAQLQITVNAAVDLTKELNALTSEAAQLRQNVRDQADTVVTQINASIEVIARLNLDISRIEAVGTEANDQRDRRDSLVNELAQLVEVRVFEQESGPASVLLGGGAVAVGQLAPQLSLFNDSNGELRVGAEGTNTALPFRGGELAAVLDLFNSEINQFQSELNEFAEQLITSFDSLHSTGRPSSGGFESLVSIPVSDPSQPISANSLRSTVSSGSLFVAVTDLSSGDRSLQEIVIDPATTTLNSLAAQISLIPGVQASVLAQDGSLAVLANPGFEFDFSGNLPTSPDLSGYSGTSKITIGGIYAGDSNDVFSFEFLGSGQIGTTNGLQVEVTNAAGDVVETIDVGLGYETGTALVLSNGIEVTFGAGNVTAAETFSTSAVVDSDSSGILAALGMNTLFSGFSAGDIGVSERLIDDPSLLGVSRTDQGDNEILAEMVQLRERESFTNGQLTFFGYLDEMVTDAAIQVQVLESESSNFELVGQRLAKEQQAVSGVDPNEELVKMLNFQKAFQMSARFITTVNATLDDLVRMVG